MAKKKTPQEQSGDFGVMWAGDKPSNDGAEVIKALALEQFMAGITGKSRIQFEDMIPETLWNVFAPQGNAAADLTSIGSAIRQGEKEYFGGKSAINYLEETYPEAMDWIERHGPVKLLDTDIYKDFPLKFQNSADLFQLLAYASEKVASSYQYQYDRNKYNERGFNKDSANEWQRFQYGAMPAVKPAISWAHSVWAANDVKDLLAAVIAPTFGAIGGGALLAKVISKAEAYYLKQAEAGHPWVDANPREASAFVYAVIDPAGILAGKLGMTVRAAEKAGLASHGKALAPILEQAIITARNILKGEGRTAAVDAFAGARKTAIEGLNAAKKGLEGTGKAAEQLGKFFLLPEKLAALEAEKAALQKGSVVKTIGKAEGKAAVVKSPAWTAAEKELATAESEIKDLKLVLKDKTADATAKSEARRQIDAYKGRAQDAEMTIEAERATAKGTAAGEAARVQSPNAKARIAEIDERIANHNNSLDGLKKNAAEADGHRAALDTHTKALEQIVKDAPPAPAALSNSDEAFHAVNTVLREQTWLGGPGIYDGSIARRVVEWARHGVGTDAAGVMPHGVFPMPTIEEAANQLVQFYHVRTTAPSPGMRAGIANWVRNASEINYPGLKEFAGRTQDFMRSYATQKALAIEKMDLAGRVKGLSSLTKSPQEVVDDVLYVLKNTVRSPGDIAGSFDRSVLGKFNSGDRMSGIAPGVIELAKEIAVKLGTGHNGGPLSITKKQVEAAAKGVTTRTTGEWATAKGGRAAAAAKENAAKGLVDEFADTAPLDVFTNWLAKTETEVARDMGRETLLAELKGMRANAQQILTRAVETGKSSIALEARMVIGSADKLADDIMNFTVNKTVEENIPGAKNFMVQALQKANKVSRIVQLFAQPLTAVKNGTNSIIEKGWLSLVADGGMPALEASGKTAESFWQFLRASAPPPVRLGIDGKPIYTSADTALYMVGKSGVAEEAPSILNIFSPMKLMTKGETLARDLSGAAYYTKAQEYLKAFPGAFDDANIFARNFVSQLEAKWHFNPDDLAPVQSMLRYGFAFPDFNARDLGLGLSLMKRYPLETWALGKSMDLLDIATHGEGIPVSVPGSDKVIRIRPRSFSGFLGKLDNITSWDAPDPRKVQAGVDAAGGEGSFGGEMARIGYWTTSGAYQAMTKINGSLLPYFGALVSPIVDKAPGTYNSMESALQTSARQIFGVDIQATDLFDWANGRNSGENREMYRSRQVQTYHAAQLHAGRELSLPQAEREYGADDMATKWIGTIFPGMKVVDRAVDSFNEVLYDAKNKLVMAGDDPQAIQDVKGSLVTENPLLSGVLPLTPKESARLTARKGGGFVGAMKDEPSEPAPHTYEAKGVRGMLAAYLGEEPKLVPAAASSPLLYKTDEIQSYENPVSWKFSADGIPYAVYKKAGFWESRSTAHGNKMAIGRILNEHVQIAGRVAATPEQYRDYIYSIKDENGVPWVAEAIGSIFQQLSTTGTEATGVVPQLIPAWAAMNLAKGKEFWQATPATDLPRGMQDNVRNMTSWALTEIKLHGGSDAIKDAMSTAEKFKQFAASKGPIKPIQPPVTFNASKNIEPWVHARVLESIQPDVYSRAANAKMGTMMVEHPEFQKFIGKLQNATISGREHTLDDAVEFGRKGIAAGTIPPNAMQLIESTPMFKDLFDRVSTAAMDKEADQLWNHLVYKDRRSGKPLGVNPVALAEIAASPVYRDWLPALQHLASGDAGAGKADWITQAQGLMDPSVAAYVEFKKTASPEQRAAYKIENMDARTGSFHPELYSILGRSSLDETRPSASVPLPTGQDMPDLSIVPKTAPRTEAAQPVQGAPTASGIAPLEGRQGLTSAPLSLPWAYTGPLKTEGQYGGVADFVTRNYNEVVPKQGSWDKQMEAHRKYIEGGGAPRSFADGRDSVPPPAGPRPSVGAAMWSNFKNADGPSQARIGVQGAQVAFQLADLSLQLAGGEMPREVSAGMSGLSAGFGVAAMMGFSPPGLVIGAAVGIMTGIVGSKKRPQYDNRMNEENLRINRERLDMQLRQEAENNRQRDIRDLRTREGDLVKAISGGAAYDKRAVATQLAQFQRRGTYASKVGLIDSLEREMASALKPKW